MSEPNSSETTWTVSFVLEPADIKAMNRRILVGRNRRFAIYTAIIFSAAGAGLGMLIAVALAQSRVPFVVVGATLGLAFIGLMLRRTIPRAIEQARQAGHFVPQTLEIDEDGFRQSYEDGRTIAYPWGRVRKVGTTATEFVITLAESTAVVVPLHAFRSKAYADLFAMMARLWHSKAEGAEGLTPRP